MRGAVAAVLVLSLGACTGGGTPEILNPTPANPTSASPVGQGVLASFEGIGTLRWTCAPTGIGGESPYQMTYTVQYTTEHVQVRSQGGPTERAVLQPGDQLVVRPQGPGVFEVRAVQATEPRTVVATAKASIPTGNGCQSPSVRSSVGTPRPVVGG